jgi:hypothetical protein
MIAISPATTVPIGSYLTVTAPCYSGSKTWNGMVGGVYTGYLIVNYTLLQSGLPHTIFGTIVQKVV